VHVKAVAIAINEYIHSGDKHENYAGDSFLCRCR